MTTLADMSPKQRSEHMALIRGRDTKPEWHVREFLRELGVAFETHVEALPGTPDVVIVDKKIAVFVHGCFWHQHGCRRQKPKVNKVYWETKFAANIARDRAAADALRADGYRVLVIWECEAKRGRAARGRLLRAVAPSRRLCHDCSNVAIVEYAHCRWCRRRYARARGGAATPREPAGVDERLRKRRRALKLCITCGMPAGDKYAMCPAHAAKAVARRFAYPSVATYQRLAAEGKCRCHAPVKPGSTRCAKCLRKLNREAKKRNKRYKDAGRCRMCPAPVLPGRIRCAVHNAKARASAIKAVAKFIKKRRDAEQCVTCGASSTTYNCEKCRRKIALRAKKKKKRATA